MILLCGIPSEPSLRRVAHALDELGSPYRWINQRRTRSSVIRMSHRDGALDGVIEHDGWTVQLPDVTGVYLRMMDDRRLPELAGEPKGSPARTSVRAFHELVGQWTELTAARVVNRYSAMASNFSKPYQLQLIAEHGFGVPTTLVTSDPDAARAFCDEHERVIYKSISSERSIVQTVGSEDLDRLDAIRWCPVQFQAFVPGTDVRVHTVGERVFATRVDSDATDYRYARRQIDVDPTFEAVTLPQDVAARCVALAGTLGLDVAGVDLRITPDGDVVCFEVNPSPVFSYYEAQAGQPIAAAVAEHLSGDSGRPAAAGERVAA